uniref:Uncharacterized protein n=1 Tax=Chelydra serpentina TaxID=8475 RepID=A0A8C3XRR3_CHESE
VPEDGQNQQRAGAEMPRPPRPTAGEGQQQFYLLLGNLLSPDNTVRKQAEVSDARAGLSASRSRRRGAGSGAGPAPRVSSSWSRDSRTLPVRSGRGGRFGR